MAGVVVGFRADPFLRLSGDRGGRVLHYRRPKSQLWGHMLKRLSSSDVLARADRFLRDRAIIVRDDGAKFSVLWDPRRSPDVARAVDSIRRRMVGVPRYSEVPGPDGGGLANLHGTLRAEDRADVAKWLDEVCHRERAEGGQAGYSHYVMFRWAGDAGAAANGKLIGGMFGTHVGAIRAVTTEFAFATAQDFQAVKAYLSEIGLVELSDKCVRGL